MKHTYTQEELQEAVKNSLSIRQTLQKLGLNPSGGNYKTTKKRLKELNINIDHFLGQGHNRGKTIGPVRPISYYLKNNSHISSNRLRQRLLWEQIFEHKCYKCNLNTWLNKPIPLELEHIDGNHLNNSLENLTLLCPNCHAQTDTYCGKNIANRKIRIDKEIDIIKKNIPIKEINCCDCNNVISTNSKRCHTCANKYSATWVKHKTKIIWPNPDDLQKEVEETSYTAVARRLGVSDTSVRKHCKRG